MEITNDSGLVLVKNNTVLVYVGDTDFFNKKLAGGLAAPEESISRAIAETTEGILLAKGSQSFKEGFDHSFEIGDKVSFKGHFGHAYSKKRGTYKSGFADFPNRAYYRIMKDTDIEALVTK